MAKRLADHPRTPLAGAVGPVVFLAAWSLLGATTQGYSATADAISELAAVDASTRVPMTAALLVYAGCIAVFALPVGQVLGRPVAWAAAVNAIATVGVAVTPLGSSVGGNPHAATATVTYGSLAAMPLLAATRLRRDGRPTLAASSAVLGVSTALCLAASVVVDVHAGAWQRTGLTIGDVWLVVVATSIHDARARAH